MGGIAFETLSFGKTADAAFRDAVDEARYLHGHSGETGTLAEKPGYELVELPPRVTAERAIAMIVAASMDGPPILPPNGIPVTRCGAGRLLDGDVAEARYHRAVPPRHRGWAEKYAQRYGDKWGPALCIPVRGRRATTLRAQHGHAGKRINPYIFFGIAND